MFEPVDLLDSLEKIHNTKLKTDYDFNIALRFYDFHVRYEPKCYKATILSQPIYLYSPLKCSSLTTPFLVNGISPNCEVLKINGRPGFEAAIEYAKTYERASKDLGVRLNNVLNPSRK